MSDAIFPTLSGKTWDVTKTPEFYSLTKTSPSGVDVAAALGAYPRWHFSLAYEWLRDNGPDGSFQKLLGFFLARRGNVEDFLFLDPTDNLITDAQVFAVGDGTTVSFQLCRTYAGFTEPVLGTVSDTEKIFVNGVLMDASGYSVKKGAITFTVPPAANARLSWTGKFYYRCRFKESSMELANFSYKLWKAGTVEFVSIKRLLE